MVIPPVIERELRLALRKRTAVKSRFRMALIAAGVTGAFLLFGLLGMTSWGPVLHQFLFFGGVYMAVIPPAAISVGLFCEERRNQTLELLYLTGMGPGELFAGKLLDGVLVASGDLLALIPFMAVPFLSGGLSLDLFWASLACFPVLLFFTLAVGVLASVLSRDDGAALVIAVILAGAIGLAVPLPYYLGWQVLGKPPFSSEWLCLSPGYAPYLVANTMVGANAGAFWLAAEMTVVWGLAGLALAGILLRRAWREEISRVAPAGWRGKWNAWLHGRASWRAALRDRVMPGNPFQWLAEQERRPVLLAWAVIGGSVLPWLLGWWAWPRAWPSPVNFYLTALLLASATGSIRTYAAAKAIGQARREGWLELLLTTPLQPREMVAGQEAALRAQFRPVRRLLLGLFALMMLGGFLSRSWNTRAAISYVIIWGVFFGWCLFHTPGAVPRAMWVALNTARPTYAVFQFHRGGWWYVVMFTNARNIWHGLTMARDFPSGSVLELVFVSIFSAFALVMAWLSASHPLFAEDTAGLLIGEMRSIAREPVPDARDPRFKNWNGRGRLPGR